MTRLRNLIIAAFRDAVANKTLRVATALGLAVTIAVSYGFWLDWEWKAMIGWKALEGYINPDPDDTTGKKDAVQVYAVIVAGVIASITAAVGLANLRLTRKNLEQQRELEAQHAQGTALQVYYEQIGNLLTKYDLRNTQREEIKELARGQTLTVLHEVDGNGKGNLLTFLHGAGLIGTENPAVALTGVDLQGVALLSVDLRGANRQNQFTGFNLSGITGTETTGQDCPGGFPTELSRTPQEGAGTVIGLIAHLDLNNDGDTDDPGESVVIWTPPAPAPEPAPVEPAPVV